VGLVVDDAVVMLENIVRHVEDGMEPFAAAVKGAKEMAFTIFSISVSLVERPNVNRTPPAARSGGSPIALRTWEGSIEPDEQAEPLEAAIPARSRLISAAAPSTPVASAPLAVPMVATPTAPQPGASASNQTRVGAGHLATGTPAAADSVATKTDFGIDVGGNASIEGLRALWTTLKATQPALFEGLRPVIAVREGKAGAVELRLVAGPLPNASIAARLCATLSAVSQSCQPTVFDGQRLALQ